MNVLTRTRELIRRGVALSAVSLSNRGARQQSRCSQRAQSRRGGTPLHGWLLAAFFAATLLAGAQPNELFQKAGRAYDTGDFAGAAAAYTALIQQGYATPQVCFNLGNAEFRLGHGGAAALDYRRAWHQAPRDADIAANLRFALEQTGAALPDAPLWARWLQSLSASEWRTAALILFWIDWPDAVSSHDALLIAASETTVAMLSQMHFLPPRYVTHVAMMLWWRICS